MITKCVIRRKYAIGVRVLGTNKQIGLFARKLSREIRGLHKRGYRSARYNAALIESVSILASLTLIPKETLHGGQHF